jgi:hypothetical protein
MVGELSNSHSYVSGGDLKLPKKPNVGLLGARFELDKAAGRYRIASIMQGENDEERYRSPLTEVGINVHAGDYILAVNGQELRANDNPYRLLQIASGQPVELRVGAKADGSRRAQRAGQADLQRDGFEVLRLGRAQPPLRRGKIRRQARLRLHSGHGRRRHPRIHQVVLSADPQAGPGSRRARQRRRQRFGDDHRASSAARCSGSTTRATRRRPAHIRSRRSMATWRR